MRRKYNAKGELDIVQSNSPEHADEVLVRLARDHMAEWPGTNFRDAKQRVLRDDMEFARQYHAMFE